MENIIFYLLGIGIIGIAYASWKSFSLLKKDEGNQHMKDVSSYINSASTTYERASYKILAALVVLLGVLLFLQAKYAEGTNGLIAVSFVVGAVLSAGAGFMGINLISKLHARTANEANTSTDNAFKNAFSGGMVNGITYASFAITGLSALLIGYQKFVGEWSVNEMLSAIASYVLGASVVALFDRLIGGVFAEGVKTAKTNISKTEEAIPENTAVNPAEIANTAGVNVNNTSGASADMVESYVAILISAMLLGIPFINSGEVLEHFSFGTVLLPLAILAIGVLTSITAGFFVKSVNTKSFWTGYRFAYYFSIAVAALASFFIVKYILPTQWEMSKTVEGLIVITKFKSLGVFWTIFIGMAAGVVMNFSTDYFTINGKPVNKLIEDTFKGHSSGVLSGTSRGFIATAVPAIIILGTISGAYYFADFYGVAMAALGFMTNMGIVLAMNTANPIAENADSLAKMTLMNDEAIQNTGELSAFTAKKEIYIKSLTVSAAALAAFAVLSAFLQKTGVSMIELNSPWTISFMIIGGLLPFLLSSTVIDAVSLVSEKAVDEIKRQFEEIPELKAAIDIYNKYFGDPDVPTQGEQDIVNAAEGKAAYNDLVIISTYSSIRRLIIPVILIISVPVLTGYFLGTQALTGLLTGIIPVGFILAFTQVNSGAAWNSTKNEIETGVIWNGEKYDKNSSVYETAKQNDEIGSIYRNASAPALNLLIKISAVIALITASVL
jgi:K(+)-stimulated pyrophosphate-energized sodium pump